MHVHAYEIVLLLFLLPCISTSRVRLSDDKDGASSLLIPGIKLPTSRHAGLGPVRPLKAGLLVDQIPKRAVTFITDTPLEPVENTGSLSTPAAAEQCGPCAEKSKLLEGCERWSSGPSPSTGLHFLIVFKDPEKRKSVNCWKRDAEMLDSFEAQPRDFDQMVRVDRDFLNQAKTGSLQYDYVAFVTKHNVVKAVFCGMFDRWSRPKSVIEVVEATKRSPVRGAVSWGFSMLLHRLKLQGLSEVTLVDASAPQNEILKDKRDYLNAKLEKTNEDMMTLVAVQDAGGIDPWIEAVDTKKRRLTKVLSGSSPLFLDGQLDELNAQLKFVEELRARIAHPDEEPDKIREASKILNQFLRSLTLQIKCIPSKGSRIYDSMDKPTRPYTYTSVKDAMKGFSYDITVRYSFDLTTEGFGNLYGKGEPC